MVSMLLLLLPIPLSLLKCIFIYNTFLLLLELLLVKTLAPPTTNAKPLLLTLMLLLLFPILLLLQLNFAIHWGKEKIVRNSESSKEPIKKDRRANPREIILNPKYQDVRNNLLTLPTSASITASDIKAKHKEVLTWLTALHEWNAQKDLTGTFISLLLVLCDPRWLAWFCVTNKSKGTSKACQNRSPGTQSL